MKTENKSREGEKNTKRTKQIYGGSVETETEGYTERNGHQRGTEKQRVERKKKEKS